MRLTTLIVEGASRAGVRDGDLVRLLDDGMRPGIEHR